MSFSLKQFLFCVGVVAFSLIAMVSKEQQILGWSFDLLTLAILVGMAYGAWLSSGETRAFRVGFLCWALLYFFLFKRVFYVGINELVSGARSAFLDSIAAFEQRGGNMRPYYSNFYAACHSLLLLLAGLFGGWVTVFVYRKRQREIPPARE